MLSHCLKCKGKTDSKNPKVTETKNGRIIASSNCSVCARNQWIIK